MLIPQITCFNYKSYIIDSCSFTLCFSNYFLSHDTKISNSIRTCFEIIKYIWNMQPFNILMETTYMNCWNHPQNKFETDLSEIIYFHSNNFENFLPWCGIHYYRPNTSIEEIRKVQNHLLSVSDGLSTTVTEFANKSIRFCFCFYRKSTLWRIYLGVFTFISIICL